MLKLSAEDHARVSVAIAEAEAKSDGEIIAIAADTSDAYHDVGLHYAVLVLFLVLAFFAIWPDQLVAWHDRISGWSTGPGDRAAAAGGVHAAEAVAGARQWMSASAPSASS